MTRKLRTIRISMTLWVGLFKTGVHAFEVEGLPADAEFIAVQADLRMPDVITILVSSDEFIELPEGAMVPPIDVKFIVLPTDLLPKKSPIIVPGK